MKQLEAAAVGGLEPSSSLTPWGMSSISMQLLHSLRSTTSGSLKIVATLWVRPIEDERSELRRRREFKFYPAHHITTGEGRAVLTDRAGVADHYQSFRDWGRDCWYETGKDNTCGKRFHWRARVPLPCRL